MPRERGDDRDEPRNDPADDGRRTDDRSRGDGGFGDWFASSAVRIGLTLIGVVLLVFAVGQAVGLPLLEMAADALATQTGRWLMVAFLAILLIAAAQRIGWTT